MSAPPLPDAHIREVHEIRIPIPYGHLAAKWWGRRDRRPILCVHGWQDNAGTFDSLIPLLPAHVGYLAIDLPGHGRSSRMPNGLLYTGMDDLYILNYVIRQFGWPKVSLLAHSMGAILAFTYAATYPQLVDMVIALDALQPRSIARVYTDYHLQSLEAARVVDLRNVEATEPPTYTFDELVEKLNSQTFLSVTRASSMYLLARAVAESEKHPGRYYFTRDNRLKMCYFLMSAPGINRELAKSIDCPYLLVKALDSPHYDHRELLDEIVAIMQQKPRFELQTVEGGHHVHLNQPHLVAPAVGEFLRKYEADRAADVELVAAKL